jgi:putative ABC transport system substrate-binding protein
MNRRDTVRLLAGCVLVPIVARAQPQGKLRRIAILDPGHRATREEAWRVFEARLRELGFAEGQNLTIDRRWADGDDARLQGLAQAILSGNPEVIVVVTTPATQALMRLTDKVPIVMSGTADPVAAGLVASLARPGRNVTGVSIQLVDVARKRLDLMRELLPQARRFALLGPAANDGIQAVFRQLRPTAEAQGLALNLADATDPPSIARAFETMTAQRIEGLLVTQVMIQHLAVVVELAARHRLPAGYVDAPFLDAGGLLVFGPDRDGPYRHAAGYVQRILLGASPADMPVMQPTEFWLGVNLRTARSLGLRVPQSILLRADKVLD